MLTPVEKKVCYILTGLQALHILDFVVIMPLGPLLMSMFKIGTEQFATLVSSYNLSAALIGFVVSAWIDTIGRKKLLLWVTIGFLLATLSCAFATNYEQFLLARVLAGGCGGVLNTLIFAYLADVVHPSRRGEATGMVMSAFSIASVLGVPLGLWLATSYFWEMSFYFIVFCGLVLALYALLFLPKPEQVFQRRKKLGLLLKHYGTLLKNPTLLNGLVLISVMSLSSFLIIPLLSPHCVANLKLKQDELKYIYLFGGIFTFLASKPVGIWCDRAGVHRAFQWIAWPSILPVLFITQLVAPIGLWLTLVATTAFMVLVTVRFIPCMTLVNGLAGPSDRGAYLGLINATRTLVVALGAYLAGKLSHMDMTTGHLVGFEWNGYYSIILVMFGTLSMIYSKSKRFQL